MLKLKNVFKNLKNSSRDSVNTDPKAIEELLTRGVEEVIGVEILRKRLLSGDRLRVKLGIDPTSPNLHLGRSIPLLKLRDFQKLGHQVVFIIGDFTGTIGDTSDKDSERPMLSHEVIKTNMKTYKEQAGKILDMSKCEVHFNSEWLAKPGYAEIGEQANRFSINEFISRELIRRRLDEGKCVSMRELLYPLMQGYDSVAVHADVELGGTDQRFNLLAGRTLQKHYGQEPQAIIMNPLVEGTDGRKMSSSWGNTVNLTDAPDEMFGKIMSIPDELVATYLTCMTRMTKEEVATLKSKLNAGGNPRDVKMELAGEIVGMYHGEEAAKKAREYFVSTFSKGEVPEDMPEFKLERDMTIVEVLAESGLCPSTSQARRDIDGGGVRLDGKVVTNYGLMVVPKDNGTVLQKGKRHFVRLIAGNK
jgi:tyrosyl-tRNA synthetase